MQSALATGRCIRCHHQFPEKELSIDPVERDPHFLCCGPCKARMQAEEGEPQTRRRSRNIGAPLGSSEPWPLPRDLEMRSPTLADLQNQERAYSD